VGVQSRKGPVVVMVPPNLIDKWEQDLDAFCALYLDDTVLVNRHLAQRRDLCRAGALRYGVARHSVEFLKLLDDRPRERCHIVFLAQGAMSRGQTDIWVRLALIRETLRRHGRRPRLQKVKRRIHKFMGKLLRAKGQQRASVERDDIWIALLNRAPKHWKDVYNCNLKQTKQGQLRELGDDPVPRSVLQVLLRKKRGKIDLSKFADALQDLPIKSSKYASDYVVGVRDALRDVERNLWRRILAKAAWQSPLLVLDEAHHLKNPKTALARQLQSPASDEDLKLGDGALAGSFDRMLFLTATPFQLGHHELVRVLQRFGDVRWDADMLGKKDEFEANCTF